MSDDKHRDWFGNLVDRLNDLKISRKTKQDTDNNSECQKTAAEYIHENEMRLRTFSMPTRNTLVKPKLSRKSQTEAGGYVFEKVKPKTKPVCLSYDRYGLGVSEDNASSALCYYENILHPEPLEMRPRTSSMPTRNAFQKPSKEFLTRSHLYLNREFEFDIQHFKNSGNTLGALSDIPYYQRHNISDWDFKSANSKASGPENRAFENILEVETRERTFSMPTKSTYTRPQVVHLRRSHQDLYHKRDLSKCSVRSFEMNSRGKLVHGSESRSTRSTNSVHSIDDDIHHLELLTLSRNSKSHSPENVDTEIDKQFPEVFKVAVKGNSSVGKTALMLQFLSTQYLGGFDTSIDGEAEKTVNVLLNGEETALAFVEQSEEDFDDDINDTVAAYLIVYACDDRESFDRAVDTLYNLRQKQHREDVIFFVGNKSDLVRSRCVTAEEAKAVAMTYDCKFVETSVVLNVKVDELLVGIVKQLRIRASEASGDKSTGCASSSKSLLNKIFRKENLSKSCENLYS